MKRLGLVGVLALAACESSQSISDEVFPFYRGKPIDTVIARWGPPEAAMRQSGGTIYTFASATQYTSTTPVTSTGAIGTVPVAITTSAPTTDALSCREHVHTDTAGRIVYIGFSGDRGACSAMLKRLK